MLNKDQLNQIEELQKICEKHDNISLKLNWDMLRLREEVQDYFHYENNILVGFIGVYIFGREFEVCGLVHPNYRRKGIFTKLLKEAISSIQNAKKILLNAPADSLTATQFLKTISCAYSFSEYAMVWNEKELDIPNTAVTLRKADTTDIETIVSLDVECFDFEVEEARDFFNRVFLEQRTFYIAELNNEPIGKISVQYEEDETWIYGFAVFPKHQGKGYGKNVLTQTILREKQTGNSIHLEVELKNRNAKKLYEDCGFVQSDTQDYYLYGL